MSTPRISLPVIDRADSGIAVLNRWVTTTPEAQQSLADATLAAWARAPWPEGLLAVNCFVSTNGDTVLSYEQWTGERELRAYDGAAADAGRAGLDREIAAAAGDAERSEPFVCRLHRSSVTDARNVPSCVVITTFAFEEAATARAWSDAICHADATQPEPTPGSISRHFLLSLDGTDVLNYSEWLDEESHRKFLENPAQTPEWQQVEEFTGLTHGPGRRCRPHGGLTAPLSTTGSETA
ncbi:antibiotic biosynthesis monooxygenase [Streptomyces sp. P9(2023)]|uniref:antibiotic biosynthesis monooxygenase n=1 Tax=Streptomyces sp. P9(2023) TaxID=3064394 RepID=UPI0028F3FC33|nr:antibiotic biosynthesis monooxygenase [Streptomyces sp. P9(2023)]MDT9691521.1 antibiotic biosynthesis monooxygenase [Streptomyces sp. P9(2023)]